MGCRGILLIKGATILFPVTCSRSQLGSTSSARIEVSPPLEQCLLARCISIEYRQAAHVGRSISRSRHTPWQLTFMLDLSLRIELRPVWLSHFRLKHSEYQGLTNTSTLSSCHDHISDISSRMKSAHEAELAFLHLYNYSKSYSLA